MIKNSLLCVIFLVFSLFSTVTLAAVFQITPKDSLPTTVPKYGKTSAYYIIKNTTSNSLIGNFIQTLPNSISQEECSPSYCGKFFNLGPQGSATESCILKLTIKAPVTAIHIASCTAGSVICDIAPDPLDITEANSIPFAGVAVGPYSNHHARYFPLLAASSDNGNTWAYPTSIFSQLNDTIDPNFLSGLLSGIGCSGSGNKTVCVAAGHYCTTEDCSGILPLIAVGRGNLTQWYYPPEVFKNLTTQINSNLTGGLLTGSQCIGSKANATCLAAGVYFTNNNTYPLIALSTNGGLNWSYPASVFQNLQTAIDPDFASGTLSSVGCSASSCHPICIAAGFYCKEANCDKQIPLVALSTDRGITWSYPGAVYKNLTTTIDPNFNGGYLKSASCSGNKNQSICIATGSYTNFSTTFPLLALSRDNGTTWTYPVEIFHNLDVTIGHGFRGGFFNANSCTDSESKAVCIAAGAYFTRSRQFPIIAVTRDGGSTWTYPDYIFTKLRSAVDPNLISAVFDGASCTGKGKNAICMAAGSYCSGVNCESMRPLLAVSTNGGKNWTYPSAIFSDLKTKIDPNFKDGLFSAVSCHGSLPHSLCIAAGQYTTIQFDILPLLALSTDGGVSWSYPPAIHQNLTKVIDPDFAAGSFFSDSTSGGELKLKFPVKPKKFGLQASNLNLNIDNMS